MIARFLDWLGSLRAENDRINTLTEQLQMAESRAEMYRASAESWKKKAQAK